MDVEMELGEQKMWWKWEQWMDDKMELWQMDDEMQ